MPATTQSLQPRPHRGPANYLGRRVSWQVTALSRQPRHLILALPRRVQRLRKRHVAGYGLEPMPRMRWYS